MEKLIHIHAKCNSFEIFEQVPERKAVQRLEVIKRMFLYGATFVRSGRRKIVFKNPNGTLRVKTCLVNPELPFIYN